MGLSSGGGGLHPFLPEGGSSGSLGLDSVGARFLHPLVLPTPFIFLTQDWGGRDRMCLFDRSVAQLDGHL